MIREIKKIYNIELVKFDGTNVDELIEFANASNYSYFNNEFFLIGIRGYPRNIRVPLDSYLVKDEEHDSIYIASNIREIVDKAYRGEISIEDEILMKEFINSYKQLEDQK